MKGRVVLIGALALSAIVAALVALRGSAKDTPEQGEAGTGAHSSGVPSFDSNHTKASTPRWDGGPLERTIRDRRVRDELRKRIVDAWAGSSEQGPTASANDAPIPPMPKGPDGKIDPQYIKDVVRADLMPMLAKCSEELAQRKPGIAGSLSLSFTIVGDDKVGGIVEDTKLGEDAGSLADDDMFTTCVRESTMSLAFRPPGFAGQVVVPLTYVMSDRDE